MRGFSTGSSGLRGKLALAPWNERHVKEHKKRMAWMPFLFHKNRLRYPWCVAWQESVQSAAAEGGAVTFGESSFLAPCATLVAEQHNWVRLGDHSSVAAECFIHGKLDLGANASVNPRCYVDGSTAGIRIGPGSRIAAGCRMFAYDHGFAPDTEVRLQRCTSRGIDIGADVWVGAGSSIVDGVSIGDHAVVGMGSVVTNLVEPWAIVAGSPARKIGDRRERGQ
mmetsp:Transcript_68298/g.154521  ORF Transcript_68298/g.154521 Transcript_68298/m.154521 type:complete len:223 (-) Transcript_68298:165-833(-)